MGKIVDLISGGMLILMGGFFIFLSKRAKE
jgi:hypothetical protein